ncbi:hypothetical protein SUGI_0842840 [Cryptomeria japonica]|nr:hypothetical protein SUGI_0842840 [Cryptomeria japonica]
MEFVLQVQIQSIVNRFPNDFRRSEERALTALKRTFNSLHRITVEKSRISILLKGVILEKQGRLYCSSIFLVFFFFCFGILCIFFLWSVIFNGHGGRQQQEFYVLEWLIGVMHRKCQDIWNFQQSVGIFGR